MKARCEFATYEAYREYLRTYAAIMAMQGFCANSKCQLSEQAVAKLSIKQADALISSLNTNTDKK